MANDWNVDDYKMEHETVDHWELRKKFMLMHKDKFPEDKVVCLAQVFTNVEFMGCRYPSETMELVAELSRGVVEEYRNSRRSKLKRTFVAASDAAEAKVKGLKRPRDTHTLSGDHIDITSHAVRKSLLINSSINQNCQSDFNSGITYGPLITEVIEKRLNLSKGASTSQPMQKPVHSSIASFKSSNYSSANVILDTNHNSSVYGGARTYTADKSTEKWMGLSKLSNFVIVQEKGRGESSVGLLLRSSSASGFRTEIKVSGQDGGFKCDLYINGEPLAAAKSSTKKLAKEEAARLTLDKLKMICYTIVVKNVFTSCVEVEKHQLANTQISESPAQFPKHNLLSHDNIGNKLLRLMGWTGGGLGASQQGIEEPVVLQEHVRRAGLGVSSHESLPSPEFKQKAWQLLRDYAENSGKGCSKDLVFSTDFSREERAEIHHIAHKLHLKSRSYKKKDRQLVVSYKYSMQDIVSELKACGGSNDKYELIPPSSESIPDVIEIN